MKTTFPEEIVALRRQNLLNKSEVYHERFDKRWGNVIKFRRPSSASGTEKAVVEFLRLKGHQAAKVDVNGTMIAPTKYKTGSRVIVGQPTFRKTSATKGVADVQSTIFGLSVQWELKYSKSDRQRPDQKKFEQQVKAAGGYYFIFHNVDDFYDLYYQLMEDPKIQLLKNF